MAARRTNALEYEKVDYHRALQATDPPSVSRRGKSKCDGDITIQEAQDLLRVGFQEGQVADGKPKAVYVKRGPIWYRAMCGGSQRYHAAPVHESRVPPKAKNQAGARWIR